MTPLVLTPICPCPRHVLAEAHLDQHLDHVQRLADALGGLLLVPAWHKHDMVESQDFWLSRNIGRFTRDIHELNMYVCVCMYVYIYIHTQRERYIDIDRERERDTHTHTHIHIHLVYTC